MIKIPERRVVTSSFIFDAVYFTAGEEFSILVNAESSDAYGCEFDEERRYDMHELHYQGEHLAKQGHGFWVDKDVIDKHTLPFLYNRTPDWEV